MNWIIEWVAQRKFSPINLHRLFSFHFRRSGKALIKQANNHFSRFFIRSRSDIGLRVFKYEFDIWMIVNIFLRSQCSGVSQRLGSLARDRLENSVKTALVNNRWPFKALKRFSASLQASNYFWNASSWLIFTLNCHLIRILSMNNLAAHKLVY